MYHAHGLFVGLGCAMTSGCEMTFLPKFDVRNVIRCLPDATVLMGIPTFYSRLLGRGGLRPEVLPFDQTVYIGIRTAAGRDA